MAYATTLSRPRWERVMWTVEVLAPRRVSLISNSALPAATGRRYSR